MAIVLKDRVKQTAAAPGTGTITLGATATGFQAFSAIGNGNVTYFAIVDPVSGAWEVNYGTYTSSGTTLSRNATPLSSSAAGALVNFTGAVDVFCTYPSEKAIYEETTGNVLIDGGPLTVVGTGVTSYTTFGAALAELYANINSFAQFYAQNLNGGASASTDIVAYNDLGDGTNNFIDMGISSSNYTEAAYPIFTPASGYVYNDGGELIIGTATATKDVLLFAGGVAATDWAARISGTNQSILTKAGLTVGGAFTSTGAATFNSTVLLNANPTLGLQAATKQYVDSAAATGFTVHPSVVYATAAALPANTYNNGVLGVGATLTATVNGALSVDGNAVTTSQRILVQNEVASANNGCYTVTQTGSGILPYILTRATDFDTAGAGEIANNAYFFVTAGATHAGSAFILSQTAAITVGTTALPFTLFSDQLNYVGGTNIDVTGLTISLTGTVAATNGGTGQSTVTTGDLLYGSAANTWSKLAKGAAYKSLVMDASATNVEWNAVALNQSGAVSGSLGATNGGTGLNSYTLGDTVYSSAANTLAKLAGNTTTTKKFLVQTGTGSVSAAPAWDVVNGADVNGNISGSAGSVANALTAGTYLTSAGTFDGSAARTFAVDATSTNTVSKVVARDSSGNFAAGTITAALTGNASTATVATNISAGAANQIPYQTGAATTSFIVAPTVASTFLSWTGSAFAYSAISTPNSVTFNNGGAGDASGTSFNGSTARTISYNTVGAPSTGGTGATGTWGISISGNAATATSATSSTTATTATNLAGGATGSIAYQSGAGATTFLADVATGNAVISGGVGVAPSYGKIGLTTHVSGTLPVANGGTGQTSFTANYIHYGSFSTSANFTYDGTTLAVAGAASGTAVSATSSGSIATILATDTGVNGANIKLVGNGATTPIKYIRAQSGIFQIINSAYSAAIFNLSDAGAISSSTWNGSTIGIAYGGTNSTATPTAGGISYGTGTAYAVTAAGTTGQVITSAGAGVPTWTTATNANTASAIVQRDASGNFSAGTITAALTGNASTATSAATWTTARTLTVGATGKSVDGSANVAWTVAEVVGFTPVQQGGGTGQGTNKVYIGWLGSALGLQIDATNFASTWPISVTGNAATATTATNVAGGVAGNVHYQTGVGTTGFVTNGTAGQVLTSNGASAPTFQTSTAASKSYAQAMRILAL